MKWLEKSVRKENTKFHYENSWLPKIPYPFLYGQLKGDFFFSDERIKWSPFEIPWIDDSTMNVLPLYMDDRRLIFNKNASEKFQSHVFCLGKYPITNQQYERFVFETGYKAPCGEHLNKSSNKKKWKGPFYPWKTTGFNEKEKPVVCVSYQDIIHYCKWVNKIQKRSEKFLTIIPPSFLWDFAVFSKIYSVYGSNITKSKVKEHEIPLDKFHHRAEFPTEIDTKGKRENLFGITDLLGNIWEWYMTNSPEVSLLSEELYDSIELKGGGFIDDLVEIPLHLDISRLPEHSKTRHSDLGFRIAAIIPTDYLPEEVQLRLSLIGNSIRYRRESSEFFI